MILFLADPFQLPTPQPEDLLQRLSATKAVFSYRCDRGCSSTHIIPINVKVHLKTTNAWVLNSLLPHFQKAPLNSTRKNNLNSRKTLVTSQYFSEHTTRLIHGSLSPLQSIISCFLMPTRVALPGKGEVNTGILIGEKVSTWQGWMLGGEGPWGPSDSTDIIAAVAAAANARVWLLLTGLRLFWQPPVEEWDTTFYCQLETSGFTSEWFQHFEF